MGYLVVPNSQMARVQRFFDPTWETNANRLMWWRTGVEIFKHYPIVGIGDVGTEKMYIHYRLHPNEEPTGHMHNNFIHIAVTLGLLGLTAFTFMIIRIFIFLWHVRRQADSDQLLAAIALGAFAVFVAFNINGFFEWNFGDAEVITAIWFVVGWAVAAWRLISPTSQTTQP
jgi:O-antigen ligase